MNVLNRKSDSEIGTASEKYELQKSLENEIENKVISIIEPVFGFGNVKVAASIKMDYSKISEQKTEFTPVNDEDGIPYSITEKKETVIDSQSATLDNDNDTILGSEATSSETVTQLYVNQNTTSIEHENGVIDDIKLSIMINSPGVTDDMLTNIQKMAANAVGGSETDIIVQAVEFAISNDVDDALSNAVVNTANVSFLLDPDFILKSVMIITMFVLGLMIITILKKGLAKTKNQTASTTRAKYESLDLEQLGQKKNPEDDYRSEIEKYVDKNPEGVADILKKWISED
jgi:flagellar M-ring protein FliF